MFIRIERASSIPISRQMAEQIRARCLSGSLKAGDRLPSVRELARELAVNQNTVLRVYEKLTGEGLLDRRHGDGTYIADRPPVRRLSGQVKQYRGDLEQIARRGLMLGLTPGELERHFKAAIQAAAGGLTSSGGTNEKKERA
ncbi:GntR family transcriptional regulator [Phycisphaerales bacterium AB-hyl4]|uniref:GntR family transcriptional regulator n=1 Tax=Natronomicrosphaera hydrolytica TaxID=3242702 RepID=A0ABV4UC13_9BACT